MPGRRHLYEGKLVKYETPEIRDYGSIAEHTFTRCNPGAQTDKVGGPAPLLKDKFCECSHTCCENQCV